MTSFTANLSTYDDLPELGLVFRFWQVLSGAVVRQGGRFSPMRWQEHTVQMAGCRRDLHALWSWANSVKRKAAPKSQMGKAIHYLLSNWEKLNNYLLDVRIELSNNRAERSIKPFVMGRKNWLFSNTAGGAKSSAVIYSLIETAKENGCDPYRYLCWVLEQAPKLMQEDGWAEKLLPWMMIE